MLTYLLVLSDDAPTSLHYVEPELIAPPECPDPLTATPCDLVSLLDGTYTVLRCDGLPFIPGEWIVYDDEPLY